MKSAFFPGSFDPFTLGHQTLVLNALQFADNILIGIGTNSQKIPYFTLESRIKHIESLFENDTRIQVKQFQGLAVDFCKTEHLDFIVRGLRDAKDFEYEKSIAAMNETISGIKTMFLMTEAQYAPINSTIVREIHKNGGIIEAFVTNSHLLVK